MKVKWTYEGKNYVISGHKGGKMYLNKYLYDGCDDILEGLASNDQHTKTIAKSKAKRMLNILQSYHSQEGYMQEKYYHEYKEQKMQKEQKEREWKDMKDNWFLWIIGIVILGVIIYILYKVWWFFVGDWAFNGPFASEYSGFDITAESIMYFIAFIVIVEEVVRRIRNGHF